MSGGDRLPSVAPDVEIADFETELVVLVPGRRRAVLLEAAPAVVFDSCRRGDAIDEVADELVAVLGFERRGVEAWLREVLCEFGRLGLVAVETDDTGGDERGINETGA